MSSNSKSGLDQCVEAFDRLKAGQPRVIEHIGIAKSKITAGIVSVEAGFDRGYLKKARSAHAPLISMIEAFLLAAMTLAGFKFAVPGIRLRKQPLS